ncbi:MAG: glycerol-3-phosphate acyltransferase [Acidobacteria bacterium]|nr:glycerol-3-phosphate acyltransferase [Acidobacteriota bacterium]
MSVAGTVVLILSYFLGAVPFGLLLGRWRGVDPRRVGSGNIGATNVIRAGGRGLGVATFLLDMAKGAACPLLARGAGLVPGWVAAAGLAAILGHCFPAYLWFRGGKGVATIVGAFLVLNPVAVAAAAVAFAVSLLAFRYVALSSFFMTLTLAVASAWRGGISQPGSIAAMACVLLVAYTHRGNWSRMLRGTEVRAFARSDSGETANG